MPTPTGPVIARVDETYTITDACGGQQRWLAAPLLEPCSCLGCCLYVVGEWTRRPECIRLRSRVNCSSSALCRMRNIPLCRDGNSETGVRFVLVDTDEAGNPLPQPIRRKWPKFLPD